MLFDIPALIEAAAKAVTAGAGIVKPFIDEAHAQKYEHEHQKRLEEYVDIQQDENPVSRARRLTDFIVRLLKDAGTAIGSLDDRTIRVPVVLFDALVTEVSEGIRETQKLNKLQFK